MRTRTSSSMWPKLLAAYLLRITIISRSPGRRLMANSEVVQLERPSLTRQLSSQGKYLPHRRTILNIRASSSMVTKARLKASTIWVMPSTLHRCTQVPPHTKTSLITSSLECLVRNPILPPARRTGDPSRRRSQIVPLMSTAEAKILSRDRPWNTGLPTLRTMRVPLLWKM